jgi:predicted Zn finger-like uncharacterized protein
LLEASDSTVMILTCPECATSYYVDDGRIPAGGRTVKCTSCNARWHAGADPEPAAEPEAAPEPPAEVEAVAAEDAPAAAPADDLEVSGPDTGLRKRPASAPRPAPAPRKGPMGAIIAWSAMAATVALVVVGAIAFRGEVVKVWPQSSGAYAGLGLPVNSLGLVIEKVKVEPTFQGGRPVLAVTGQIRNVADHAADAPALRIDLLNRAGKPVAAKLARPIDPRIPAGALRHFAISIVDPPSTAHDLQVAFDTSAKAQAEPHAAEAVLTPAPVEAQPLPAGAPDALPGHG